MLYEFKCKKCQINYDILCDHDPTGKYKGIVCPECNSKKKERIFSSPTVVFKEPRNTSKWDSFSYRAGKTMEEAKETRRNAEAKTHMGVDPYDSASVMKDLNNDKLYGKVK